MMKYILELDENEKMALLELIHIAVKSAGIEGGFAQNAIHLVNKIKNDNKPDITDGVSSEHNSEADKV